jgi:CRP/FNR family cyclic AMP-dependent transcriptional regulator
VALPKAHKRELLAGLPLLAHCTKKDLAALAAVVVDETFDAGHVLTREGQLGGLAYVLVSGTVTLRRKGRRVGRLGPGSIVGELSLIDGGPRTATVSADVPVEVLSVNADDFRRVVLASPRLTLALLRTLAERIRDADQRVATH